MGPALDERTTGRKVDALIVDGFDHLAPMAAQRTRNSNSYTDGKAVAVTSRRWRRPWTSP